MAHIFFIIGGSGEVLFYFSLLPFNIITEYSSGVGLVFESLALSYLLLYKIRLLQAKEKLLNEQSKLATLGEMIANIAHQWKQPLAQLHMSNNLIMAKINLQRISLEEIHQETESQQKVLHFMSTTIDTFENFYRQESREELFRVQKAFENTKVLLNATLTLQNIEIVNKIDPSITLEGNINALSQVMLSMMQNSSHFFKTREIANPTITLNCTQQDAKIVLSIEDNAGGVEPQYIDKIFNYNFSKRDNGAVSTGIGLYMVKTILKDKFSATIEVKNSHDGVKFMIVFII